MHDYRTTLNEVWENELRIRDNSIKYIDNERLLGIVLDNHLQFDLHLKRFAMKLGGRTVPWQE